MIHACVSWLPLWGKTLPQMWLLLNAGAHCRSEAENWGTVQRAPPVPVPGRETPAGEAEDGGASGADKAGRAQGPAQCGDISSAQSYEWYRGQTQRTGSLHATQGEWLHSQPHVHTHRYLAHQRHLEWKLECVIRLAMGVQSRQWSLCVIRSRYSWILQWSGIPCCQWFAV